MFSAVSCSLLSRRSSESRSTGSDSQYERPFGAAHFGPGRPLVMNGDRRVQKRQCSGDGGFPRSLQVITGVGTSRSAAPSLAVNPATGVGQAARSLRGRRVLLGLRRGFIADRCKARQHQPCGNRGGYAYVNGHRAPPRVKYAAEYVWLLDVSLFYDSTAEIRSFFGSLHHALGGIHTICMRDRPVPDRVAHAMDTCPHPAFPRKRCRRARASASGPHGLPTAPKV